jgi:hypothetical protein
MTDRQQVKLVEALVAAFSFDRLTICGLSAVLALRVRLQVWHHLPSRLEGMC